jgi:PAS domain S-box-containing protein
MDAILLADVETGTIIDCNRAASELVGRKKSELIGRHQRILHPSKEVEGEFSRTFKQHRKAKEGEVLETQILTKDRDIREVAVKANIFELGGKRLIQGIFRDITKRKEMEDAVERQRDIALILSGTGNLIEALNRLLDNLLEIDEFDCAGFYLFHKGTGTLDMISHRNLPKKFVKKVGHLDADSLYTKLVMKKKAIYQKTSDFPATIREDIESTGILSVAAIPVQYEGELIGHLNMASHTCKTVSDSSRHLLESVTAQIGETIARLRMEEKLRKNQEKLRQYSKLLQALVKKTTDELLESEKRYSVLVEEASDGVTIIQDGKIVFVNKRAAERAGYSKDELVGLPIEKPVSEQYRHLVLERYRQRLRGEKIPATYEIEVLTKTGKSVPVELSATRIIFQGRPADLVIARDLRERKRLEEQRSRLERLATMGELATMVAHDLRNPLTSIRNASFYIKNTCPCITNPQCRASLEMLDIIQQETVFADNIINDLLDFSTKRPPQKEIQNLREIVEFSLGKINVPENINVEVNFEEKATAAIDRKQFERVFLNLIKNAVQAMPDGGKLTVTANEKKDLLEMSFTDTGVGISEKNMNRLFTPLFTTKAKGIGMGLAICKKIVEEHGGTIEAQSKGGQGATFTIRLPKKGEENVQ